jgi:hypothetical protein
MRRGIGIFVRVAFGLLPAFTASADDKDLLRTTGSAPPNLLIVFGNSQTTEQPIVGSTRAWDGDADSPASKMASAKRVVKDFVLNRHTSYNIGLTTFAHSPNQGSITIRGKHWIYSPLTVDFPNESWREPIGTIERWGNSGEGPCTNVTVPGCTDRSPNFVTLPSSTATVCGPFFSSLGSGKAYIYIDGPPGNNCNENGGTALKRVEISLTGGKYGDAFSDGTLSSYKNFGDHSMEVRKQYQERPTPNRGGWANKATTPNGSPGAVTVPYIPSPTLSSDMFWTTGIDEGIQIGFLNDPAGDLDVNASCSGWEFQSNSNPLPLIKIPRDYKWGASCQPAQDSFPCVSRLLRLQSKLVSYDQITGAFSSVDPDNPGYTGTGSKYADGCDPSLLGAVDMGLDFLENNAVFITRNGSQAPIKNLLIDILNYFTKPSIDGFQNGKRLDDPNKSCRSTAVILVYDNFNGCQNDTCNQLITQVLSKLAVIPVPVYVIGLGSSAGSTSNTGICIARETGARKANGTDPGYFEVTSPEGLLQALEDIGSIVNEGKKGFVGSTVSSAQSKGDQAVYLATFNAAASRSIWNGRLNAYKLDAGGNLQPGQLTITDPQDPNKGITLFAPSNNPASLLWNAGENLADTPGTGADTPSAVLGPGDLLSHGSYDDGSNDGPTQPIVTNYYPGRKIVFSLPQTYTLSVPTIPIHAADAVPENRNDMTFTTSAPWWLALKALMGPQSGPPFVASSPLDDTDAGKALRFIWGDRDAVIKSTITLSNDDPRLYSGLKLGDIFHASPVLVGPPNHFAYFASNLHNYVAFRNTYSQRRRVLLFGANDGLFHAVDAGGFDRDPSVCATGEHCYDLGTGAELFAYAPRSIMQIFKPLKDAIGPQTPRDEWTVDGPPTAADVFIDGSHSGTPDPAHRAWHTVIVGGAREGSPFEGTTGAASADSYGSYFALDITQPDPAGPTSFTAPGCLNANATCGRAWPTILWEISDVPDGVHSGDQDASGSPGFGYRDMGETWSKPAIGRVKVCTSDCDSTSAPVTEDHYVAIFGGGFDRERLNRRGNWLYMVDVETGKVLYRANCGIDSRTGGCTPFGSVPSEPAALDFNGDGYLDLLYFGDLKGQLWRIDLTDLRSLSSPGRWSNQINFSAGSGKPFLLFQAPQSGTLTCTGAPVAPATYPIYYRPTAVSLGYSVSGKPALGVAFGTGDRDDILARIDPASLTYKQRIYYVVDKANTVTRTESDLYDIPSSNDTNTPPIIPPSGWFIELACGERVITDSISVSGVLFFSTFNPSTAQSGSGPCSNPAKCGSLATGTARLFRVFYSTGNPYLGSDRAETQQYGAFLSEPIYFQSSDQTGNIMYTTENTVKTEKAPGGKKTVVKSWKERSRRP